MMKKYGDNNIAQKKPSTDGRGQKINMSKRHFYANIRFLGEGIAQTIMCIVAMILNFDNQPLTRFCKPHTSATKSVSPVGRDNLMFLNYIHSGKRAAFSLIEALIILLIISLTIAVSIPLLTQKLTIPGWTPVRKDRNNAISTLNYGRLIGERIGIGTINPYDNNTEGKLVVGSMAIKNNANIADNDNGLNGSITWGMGYNNNQYSNPNYQLDNATKSIIIGNNTCENTNTRQTPRNSIHIVTNQPVGNNAFAYTCANNNINIKAGNNTSIASTGGSNLTLRTASASLVLNNNSDITFNANNTDIFAYNSTNDTLTINTILDMTGKDLYLSNYSALPLDDPNNRQPDECSNNFRVTNTGNTATYCDATNDTSGNDWKWTTSDKRLKNIISNYTKGLKELYKVDTYVYTFKSDKKQKLSVGILAQKLKGIFDEALHKDSKGYYSYEKEPLLYAMVNAVKSINKKQLATLAEQKRMNDKADKLIRMYK